MKRVTPSLVISIIALFVALGGGAFAAASAIDGHSIKNRSIPAIKLTQKAVAQLHGARGPRGFTGAKGATGAQGVQGPQGVPGVNGVNGVNGGFDPAKVTYVLGPDVTVAPGATGISFADCPAGSKIVGGGYLFSYPNGGMTVEISAPDPDGTAWGAGFGNSGTIAGTASAYAVCAAK
jgi:hypothetical protein